MMSNCGCTGKLPCGCCKGVEDVTPLPVANRPGLSSLNYRAGTHAAFFETMQAQLSGFFLDTPGENQKADPLKYFKTRSLDDPSIALLDSAAAMLDVLTFYQERIANEGYLRTAAERRSILELGRLVGYEMRPGVSASVYLAYTLDDTSDPVEIPAGALAKSVPAQDELPQSFETAEKLAARKEWNNLKPRGTRPHKITVSNAKFAGALYFAGLQTNLKPGDPLLLVFEGTGKPVLRKVATITPLPAENKTRVTLRADSLSGNPALPVLEKYSVNFKDYGLDNQDPSTARALKLLLDLKAAIDSDNSNQPDRVKLTTDAIDVINEIDQSQNKCLQKWFFSFVSEIKEAFLALNSVELFIKNFSFFQPPGFLEAFQALRARTGNISELLERAIYAIRNIPTYIDQAKIENFRAWMGSKANTAFDDLIALTTPLSKPPSRQPSNSANLDRKVANVFDLNKDTLPRILTSFNPAIGDTAYKAWGGTAVPQKAPVKVYALRATMSLFGSTAPQRSGVDGKGELQRLGEPFIVEMREVDGLPPPPPPPPPPVDPDPQSGIDPKPKHDEPEPGKPEDISNDVAEIEARTTQQREPVTHERQQAIHLDISNDKIHENSWVVVDTSGVLAPEEDGTGRKFPNFTLTAEKFLISRAQNVSQAASRADYGVSGKTTLIGLDRNWITYKSKAFLGESGDAEFQIVRNTIVHAQSEELELAEEPVEGDVCGDVIELGGLYNGLQSGRWLIVSGERTDIAGVAGVMAGELVMLKDVVQSYDPELPGDKTHSTLVFANKLAYTYKRETVVIYGNVVKATNGETRNEVLGSGDATKPNQAFALKQPPLTHVSAPVPSGIQSTLQVRVNDVEWSETDSLAGLQKQHRKFITKTDDAARTTVVFGNGEKGSRLPTGVENVSAVYRNGIGKAGNVKAGQISMLMTKPLGVREVINPLRAAGGADKETRDQARRNVPIALKALDRLVSTRDYADFARTFAGIGKASAVKLFDGIREVVHLTIAGLNDIPIDQTSDVYRNLRIAFAKNGDPQQPVRIDMRELVALIISAGVRIRPEYQWEKTEPRIRAALLEKFSFEQRELGQTAYLSEVIGTIQGVTGVEYVDVDVFDSLSELEILNPARLLEKRVRIGGVATAIPGFLEAVQPLKCVPAALAMEAGGDLRRAKLSADRTTDKSAAKSTGKSILPAQLAYLLPGVADTLILKKIEEVKK